MGGERREEKRKEKKREKENAVCKTMQTKDQEVMRKINPELTFLLHRI